MNEQNQDPLKNFFQSFPELEPPVSLKYRILNEIRSQKKSREFWFLKPAVALASILLLALLGAKVTIQLLPEKVTLREASPILQWAKQVESPFPKVSYDRGGFLS